MATGDPYPLDSRIHGAVQRYIHGEETLRITAFNAASGVRLRMSGRRFDTSGSVSTFSDTLTPTTNRAASVFDKPLTEGWLLSVAVRVDAGAPLDGQCYVLIELGLGTGSQFVPLDVLVADVITAAHRVAWPGSPLRGPLEGAGAVRSIAGTTPGAGAEISETVPTGARWELLAFGATLTASAVVATRIPVLLIDDGTTQLFGAAAVQTRTASGGTRFFWAAGAPYTVVVNATTTPNALPVGVRLPAAFRIRTTTISIDVGDQYSAVQYLVKEWIEGA
jgi:hypothetical protein